MKQNDEADVSSRRLKQKDEAEVSSQSTIQANSEARVQK